MESLPRIEAVREALNTALQNRDWEAIGELDLACRAELDDLLHSGVEDEGALRENLEALLRLYRQLIEIASGERQSLVEQMSNITQAKSAAKVYHLFS